MGSPANGRTVWASGRCRSLAACSLPPSRLFFSLVLVRTSWGPLHRIDFDTAAALHRSISGHLSQVRLWEIITTVGGPAVLRIAALIAAIVVWFRGARRSAVLIVATMAGAALLSGITKVLVDRVRPVLSDPVDQASRGSFPSGHALTSCVAMGLLLVTVLPVISQRRWRVVLMVAARTGRRSGRVQPPHPRRSLPQ
jgi:membrane-associated phospholipid phosphatase